MENNILGLTLYFFPVIFLSKKKRALHHGMRKLRGLKVRRYTAYLIDLNKYLASFSRGKLSDKIGVTELNESFLDSMPNRWTKQAYVQRFACESILFTKNKLISFDTFILRSLSMKV